MLWLATIGYEGATLDDFLATLREAAITILIDASPRKRATIHCQAGAAGYWIASLHSR